MQLKMASFLFPEFASAEVQKVDLENQFDPFLSLLVEVALKRQTAFWNALVSYNYLPNVNTAAAYLRKMLFECGRASVWASIICDGLVGSPCFGGVAFPAFIAYKCISYEVIH